jgi:phosphatidylglycerol---prolipoprotein diacylglyceryl transferase
VHAFGILVACGVLLGAKVLQRRGTENGLADRSLARFINWVLIGGFLGAHLFDRLVYFPHETLADPLSLLRLWEGLSSFGGFLGGTIEGQP